MLIYRTLGKGDPPSSSMSAKDKALEQECDSRLPNPMKLPAWISDHDRRTTRVNIDVSVFRSVPEDKSY